jgi:hypothetical protein
MHSTPPLSVLLVVPYPRLLSPPPQLKSPHPLPIRTHIFINLFLPHNNQLFPVLLTIYSLPKSAL